MKHDSNFAEVYNQHIKNNSLVLSEVESKLILSQYGIPVPRGIVVKTLEEVSHVTSQLSFPLVAKIAGELLHKTEIDGVITAIKNTEELIDAYNTLIINATRNASISVEGILLEEQASGTVEIIAGISNDAGSHLLLLKCCY